MQVSPHTGWLPSKLATIDGRRHVLAVKMDVAAMHAPFIQHDLDAGRETALLPLDEVMQWDLGSDPLPVGFIFHMSRTGSTAACMMLRAAGDLAVVAEPLAINGLFFRTRDDEDEELLAAQVGLMLRWFISALGTRRRVVFKFASWLSLHLDRFRVWYPTLPIVFMYRNPVEVVSAIVNRAPFMFQRTAMRQRFEAPPAAQPDYEARTNATLRGLVDYRRECDYVEFVARFLGAMCEPAAASLSGSHPVYPVAYSTFKQQVLDVVAPAFGMRVDAGRRDLMLAAARYDAKARQGRRLFEDDSLAKQMQATPLMAEYAERFIQPSIDRLMGVR